MDDLFSVTFSPKAATVGEYSVACLLGPQGPTRAFFKLFDIFQIGRLQLVCILDKVEGYPGG